MTENIAPNRALRSRIGAIAVAQHGVFTRGQALSGGMSRAAIDDRIRRGLWVAVDHGVYRAFETPPSWHQRLLAACLAGPAVASHRSAAALWHLPPFEPGLCEVTALRHRRRKSSDVVWHESLHLEQRHVTEIDGVPVTRPVRTLLDLGAVVDHRELLVAFDDAVRRKLTDGFELGRELEQFDERRRGSGTVRRVLEQRPWTEPVPESVLESLFDVLVRDHGLPRPVAQYTIRADDGSYVGRVDFAYIDARLAIEIDGMRHHAGPEDWADDLRRQNQIVTSGWRVLRFTARDLRQRTARAADIIRRALEHGPASLNPEWPVEGRIKAR